MIIMRWIVAFRAAGCRCLAAELVVAMSVGTAAAGEPRLNQIQVIGTHN
jgi:hypothetical protein